MSQIIAPCGFKKVINPCVCEVYTRTGNTAQAKAYVEISFKDGSLSLHGVIGPMSNGDCRGSAGQCVDEIRKGVPANNWTNDLLQKLCDIWDKWHLNDMRPDCEHQRADLAFQQQKNQKIIVYKWLHLHGEISKEKGAVSEFIKTELATHGAVTLSDRQHFLYNLQDCIYNHIGEYDHTLYYHKERDIEYKTLNWVNVTEHKDGLLCKPCPVCGYKYGSKWLKEEVPQDVIDWLYNLPKSDTRPAWV